MTEATPRALTRFEGTFRAHYAPLFHFLRRLLPSLEDVEDCLQETFFRFWRSGFRHDEQGREKAYLFKIARNLAIDHHRSRRGNRERTASLESLDPALKGPTAAGAPVERIELLKRVREKVGQLPLPQRETFLLFRYHGMTYQEIAEIQGVSVKTVDSRLYRAMKWLSQQLNGYSVGFAEGEK